MIQSRDSKLRRLIFLPCCITINDLFSLISVIMIIPGYVHGQGTKLCPPFPPSRHSVYLQIQNAQKCLFFLAASGRVHCLEKEKRLIVFLIGSIAKISFKGKQRNDPSEAERLGNMSVGTKVSSTPCKLPEDNHHKTNKRK